MSDRQPIKPGIKDDASRDLLKRIRAFKRRQQEWRIQQRWPAHALHSSKVAQVSRWVGLAASAR